MMNYTLTPAELSGVISRSFYTLFGDPYLAALFVAALLGIYYIHFEWDPSRLFIMLPFVLLVLSHAGFLPGWIEILTLLIIATLFVRALQGVI